MLFTSSQQPSLPPAVALPTPQKPNTEKQHGGDDESLANDTAEATTLLVIDALGESRIR